MKINKSCEKELTLEQKLKIENKELKAEISKLNKIIDRINPEHPQFNNIKKIKERRKKLQKKKVKRKKWECHECSSGVLQITLFTKADNCKYYFRKCSNPKCGNRTKPKKYIEKEVEYY